jgi:hypothetical protein
MEYRVLSVDRFEILVKDCANAMLDSLIDGQI